MLKRYHIIIKTQNNKQFINSIKYAYSHFTLRDVKKTRPDRLCFKSLRDRLKVKIKFLF